MAHAQTPSDAIVSDVTFQASVPSGQSVAGVQWYLDNTPFGAEDTTSPYIVTVSLSSIPAGSHTMTARFRPSSGSIVSTQVFGFSSILPSPLPSPTPAPTPPPSTISCHQYTPTSTIPQGYGAPYDVLSANQMLMTAVCSATDVTLNLGRGDALQYVYNTGYHYRTGMTGWTPLSYTSPEQLIANAWYPKNAHATLSLDATQQAQDTYALAYFCSWNPSTGSGQVGQWKCGCRDSACTQSYWQIQSFKR